MGQLRRFASPMDWAQGQVLTDSMRVVDFALADGRVQAELFSRPGRRFIAGGPGEFSVGPLFDPFPRLVQLTDSTLLYSSGLDYELDVLAATGRVIRRIRRQIDATPVTETLVDEYGRAVEQHYDSRPSHPGQDEEMVRMTDGRAPLVSTVPIVGQVLGGVDGSFWVERWDLEGDPVARELQMAFGIEEDPQEEVWEVFDSTGRALAEVRLPIRFEPHVVALGYVVGVWRDDLDVEYVVRFGVEP